MTPADVPPLTEARKRFERWYLIEVLRIGKTITAAAKIAGIGRTSFYKVLRLRGVIA